MSTPADAVAGPPSATAAPQSPGGARRPCNIVLLSDGTGNSRGKAFQTNVWRVYEALDLTDPATPPTPRQFAFYDDGVGSSSFKLYAVLGGALGLGLARNVRDLYEFLCRTYQPGDRIFAFGFSRGAFTIRVLVGLIVNQGLVQYTGSEAELSRLAKAAYRAYRRERFKLKYFNYLGPLRALRDGAAALSARLRGKPAYAEAAAGNLRPEIEFLGLWDTVAAYGVPVDEIGAFINAFIWPFEWRDSNLSAKVRRGAHALALDDERNTFHPKLWNSEPPRDDGSQRISQVWFAGMHSDVGGGYADKGMAHVSLHWMVGQAQASGLLFLPEVLQRQQALADENGPLNDSRRGLAGYYRYNPRRLSLLLKPYGIARPVVHQSVLRRIREGLDAYAPVVLPSGFDVQLMAGGVVRGEDHLKWTALDAARYRHESEAIWNRVWLRRVVYFATLAVTLLLLALPLVADDSGGRGCDAALCVLSPFVRALDVALPTGAERWTGWHASHPHWFWPLALAALAGLRAGGWLQRSIFDRMRAIWYATPATRPAGAPQPGPQKPPLAWLAALRSSAAYQAGLAALRHYALPGVFGVALLAVTAMLANNLSFALMAARGTYCKRETGAEPAVGLAPAALTLDTARLCVAQRLRVERGGTYELRLAIDDKAGWFDGKDRDRPLRADLHGLRPGEATLPMRLASALKRELSQPYLAPMARIGQRGSNVLPLQPDPPVPLQPDLMALCTTFVAPSSGPLYLYVNDAVGLPLDRDRFQRNNAGTASGSIRLVAAAGAASAPPASSAPCR